MTSLPHFALALTLALCCAGTASAQATPTMSLHVDERALMDDTFSATLDLDNTGTSTGYAPRATLTLPDGVSFVASEPPARVVSKDGGTGVTTVHIDFPVTELVPTTPALEARVALHMDTTLTSGAAVTPDAVFSLSAFAALFATAAATGSPFLGATVSDGERRYPSEPVCFEHLVGDRRW